MSKRRVDTYEVRNGCFWFEVNKYTGRVVRSGKVEYQPDEFEKRGDGSWWRKVRR